MQDHFEAIEQPLEVGDPQVHCDDREAGPVQPTHPVPQKPSGPNRDSVAELYCWRVFALKLDAAAGVQQGPQFFPAASRWL